MYIFSKVGYLVPLIVCGLFSLGKSLSLEDYLGESLDSLLISIGMFSLEVYTLGFRPLKFRFDQDNLSLRSLYMKCKV